MRRTCSVYESRCSLGNALAAPLCFATSGDLDFVRVESLTRETMCKVIAKQTLSGQKNCQDFLWR